jgi:hypothetical protein
MAKFILWTPRILALLIAAFVVLMALDNFTTVAPADKQVLGFFISIAPAIVLIAGMIIALRYKIAGGIAILLMGIIMSVLLRISMKSLPFLILSTPVIVTGILFILSHFYERTSLKK